MQNWPSPPLNITRVLAGDMCENRLAGAPSQLQHSRWKAPYTVGVASELPQCVELGRAGPASFPLCSGFGKKEIPSPAFCPGHLQMVRELALGSGEQESRPCPSCG